MSEAITHQGIVKKIAPEGVSVQIVQSSACSACHAQSSCSAADSAEKIIEAQPLTPMQVGDEVEVTLARRLGWKAVALVFVLPFCIVIGLVAGLGQIMPETWSGTIALCALLPYFFLLHLFNRRLKKQFVFYASRKAENLNS